MRELGASEAGLNLQVYGFQDCQRVPNPRVNQWEGMPTKCEKPVLFFLCFSLIIIIIIKEIYIVLNMVLLDALRIAHLNYVTDIY